MPTYNFKKKVKFYVVVGGLKYRVDIFPDVSFSQTFKESSRRVKTLHAQTNMFDAAIINEASPANFDFTMPLYETFEQRPVLDLLLKYATNTSEVTLTTADIYVDTDVEIFKLEKCVFERGTFNLQKTQVTSVSISGTASKLIKFGPSGTTIPGTLQPSNSISSIFIAQRYMLVKVNTVTQPNIIGVSIEVVNDVEWLSNNTLHKSLAVTGPSDTTYPEGFVVRGRTVSGSINQFLTNDNIASANTWGMDVPIEIRIGNNINVYRLSFYLTKAVYTNRLESGDLFMQNYDFRLTSNPNDLSTLVVWE